MRTDTFEPFRVLCISSISMRLRAACHRLIRALPEKRQRESRSLASVHFFADQQTFTLETTLAGRTHLRMRSYSGPGAVFGVAARNERIDAMIFTVSAFYKFARVEDCEALRADLFAIGERGGLYGTILVAPEGINATIAGPDAGVRALLAHLRADRRFAGLVSKESFAATQPFQRWKVKVKPEILTFGAPEADPTVRAGTYVRAQDWNDLIARDDVLLIDTRNDYEVAVGTFRGAVDPKTRSFTDFKSYVAQNLEPAKHSKIAMFCTGGIRCEKASAYLRAHGFDEVYHLEGGILKYLEDVPAEQSRWDGACFVFDERVAVGHGVTPSGHRRCRCGWALAPDAQTCPSCGAAVT